MRIDGKVNIKANRSLVWKSLVDAELVSQCMPGVESLSVVTPDKKFRVTGAIGLGTVKVKFKNDVEWTELDPENTAKMKMRGTAPGSSIDMVSVVTLLDGADDSTDMEWWADIKVMGTIASLAARLMKPVSTKLTGEFFKCLKKKIEAD